MIKMSLKQPKTEHSRLYRPKDVLAAEIEICINCPLPKCERMECKRYNEEMAKIKAAKKGGKKNEG